MTNISERYLLNNITQYLQYNSKICIIEMNGLDFTSHAIFAKV